MKRALFLLLPLWAVMYNAAAQSLKKPSITEPSLTLIKVPKYHKNSAGSMGLFDWNMSLGYIDRSTTLKQPGQLPTSSAATGQYFMLHLQESVLSNYFLASKYKRNKRLKIGIQNTIDIGTKWGTAAAENENYNSPQESSLDFFLNYQLGIATALRIRHNLDVGFTYYLYTKTVFSPNTDKYSKARIRFGHLMAEYSFGGLSAVELKYVKSSKVYYGVAYSNYNRNMSNLYPITAEAQTKWYHISIGKVF